MPEGETGNIYDVLKNTPKKYAQCFEVIKGELIYANTNKQQLEWALELGMKINPYYIVDGVLMSSDTNLMLMDENTGTVVLPESVTKVADGAFRDVQGIRRIIIPGTVKEIGNYAFSGNSTLEEVIIQEGTQTIGSYAFESCVKLKKIEMPTSITRIDIYALRKCTSLENIELPANATIYAGVFEDCISLKVVKLPEKLKEIQTYTFAGNAMLETLEIPGTVTSISESSFPNCPKLKDIILVDNKNYKYENGILMKKDGTSIAFISASVLKSSSTFKIPEGIKNFSTNIEYGNITKLILPSSLESISPIGLPYTISSIEVDNNPSLIVQDNCLYSKDKKNLYICFSKDKNITIGEGTEILGTYSFKLANMAENVTLPNSLTTIHANTFTHINNIKKINMGKNVSNISATFKFRTNNAIVEIDNSNPYYKVEDNIIYSKNGEKMVTVLYQIQGEFVVESNVKEIGPQCFYEQTGLTTIKIHNNVTDIKKDAFQRCNKLTKIIIDKAEGSIAGAPWGCPNTREVVVWK